MQAHVIHYTIPEDSQSFLSQWKGKSFDGDNANRIFYTLLIILYYLGLVEQVRDGTTLRIRLFMPEGEHQMVTIALAGVRSPRVSSKPGEPSEQWAEEVRLSMSSHVYCINCL